VTGETGGRQHGKASNRPAGLADGLEVGSPLSARVGRRRSHPRACWSPGWNTPRGAQLARRWFPRDAAQRRLRHESKIGLPGGLVKWPCSETGQLEKVARCQSDRRARGDRVGVRDSGFGIRGSGFGTRDSGLDSGPGIRDSGFGTTRIRDSWLPPSGGRGQGAVRGAIQEVEDTRVRGN
jgi:hypothetical protein